MRLRIIYISMILLCCAASARAQKQLQRTDTTIKSSTIEIVQSYKPEVKQVPKPEMQPGLPPADTSHPSFKYEVPEQTLTYTYSAQPLRPLALAKDTAKQPFADYLKLGAGNLSTIYLDAGIGMLKGKNYSSAIHLHHLSQKGNIASQQTSLSGLKADGYMHTSRMDWHAGLSVLRNRYGLYGYDHDSFTFANSDSLKQVYTGIRLNVDMHNSAHGDSKFDYTPAINVSYYGDKFTASETTFGFNLPGTYHINDNLHLSLAVSGDFTQFKVGSVYAFPNKLIRITPGIQYQNQYFSAHAYLSPAFGESTYFLPDIAVSFMIPKTQLAIKAGWLGSVARNTFEQLTTENPYMFNIYNWHQSHSNEVYAGIQSNIGQHIYFTGKLSWWQFKSLPLFLNDSADMKQFYIVYDTLHAVSLQASIRYLLSNSFSVGFSTAWYKYSGGTQAQVWHVPTSTFKGDFVLRPIPTLSINGYISVLDNIHAIDKYKNDIQLDDIIDIGAGAEYLFIRRLSAFIQVNNILGNNYQRWLGYPAYGINIYGGLRVKF
ncbi:MAG: hypothetical protein JSS82_18540 [Bacteroidetes bacterium]|nr:hypothetical protein [Bacteroidota bacterium]